ncbi:MAG: hypothetical protein HC769_23990 [Cyanobacteria bacterium CRU_2_1]|nr:hypothetical protein [Cyanobacteria bacterium RU_5_0]NJR61622.1 hypothetical protein [Cyanobacteria bacterium CRU_2_1]
MRSGGDQVRSADAVQIELGIVQLQRQAVILRKGDRLSGSGQDSSAAC